MTVIGSGYLLALFLVGILISAFPQIRKKMFEMFYYLHIIFAIGIAWCAFYHSGMFVVILSAIVWGSDIFTRRIIMPFINPVKAEIKNLTTSIVQLEFPKTSGFNYNPGQYVYIAIPELSLLQWHPFSISSSPHQGKVTFHIRKQGNWTSKLVALAEKRDEIKIMVEGPYGSLCVDLISKRYKLVMLLSGGIGVVSSCSYLS